MTVSLPCHQSVNGQWYVLAASVLWGTTGTAQAFAPDGAQPMVVGAVRLLIGGLTMLLFALGRGALRSGKSWPIPSTILAACGVAVYQLCFFAGVAKTGVAVGTIVTMGSAPIIAGILGFLVMQERPGARWFIATLCAVTGCGMLVAAGSSMSIDVSGVFLALGAGGGYAAYSVFGKTVLTGRSPVAVTAVICSLAALFLIPVLVVGNLHWLTSSRGILVALHLGVVATAAPYFFFARGLLTVPVANAVTLTLAEPLTAGTLGILVLGEQLTLQAVIGIGCIFIGLALLSMPRKR